MLDMDISFKIRLLVLTHHHEEIFINVIISKNEIDVKIKRFFDLSILIICIV